MGSRQPAGMGGKPLYSAERPRPVAQAYLTSEAGSSSAIAQVVRKGIAGLPHDKVVPVDSFKDDLVRKLTLRKVMGKRKEREKKEVLASDKDALLPGDQFTKEEVNYRYSGYDGNQCGDCKHYIAPASCELVAGLIRSTDLCDKFEPLPSSRGAAVVPSQLIPSELTMGEAMVPMLRKPPLRERPAKIVQAYMTEQDDGGDSGDDGDTAQCEDFEKDAMGRCPDDPDFDDATAGQYEPDLLGEGGEGAAFDSLVRSLAQRGRKKKSAEVSPPGWSGTVKAMKKYMAETLNETELAEFEAAVRDPKALAAWIGRKKYGKAKFQRAAAKGKALASEAEPRIPRGSGGGEWTGKGGKGGGVSRHNTGTTRSVSKHGSSGSSVKSQGGTRGSGKTSKPGGGVGGGFKAHKTGSGGGVARHGSSSGVQRHQGAGRVSVKASAREGIKTLKGGLATTVKSLKSPGVSSVARQAEGGPGSGPKPKDGGDKEQPTAAPPRKSFGGYPDTGDAAFSALDKAWQGQYPASEGDDGITNPFALAWWMKNRGYKSHIPPEPTKKGKAVTGETGRIVPVVRATLAEDMSVMGSHKAISDVPGSPSQNYVYPGTRHGRRKSA